jgi:hypothetical protein
MRKKMANPELHPTVKKTKEEIDVARFNEKRHFDKIIPLRISSERWEEVKKEAGALDMSSSALARMLITDGLRRLRQGLKPGSD